MENKNLNEQLFDAVIENDLEQAKLLIEKGADVNVKDERGNTPLYYAAFNDCLEVAELLIEKGADLNDKTPLYHAICYGGVEFVKLFKKHGGK